MVVFIHNVPVRFVNQLKLKGLSRSHTVHVATAAVVTLVEKKETLIWLFFFLDIDLFFPSTHKRLLTGAPTEVFYCGGTADPNRGGSANPKGAGGSSSSSSGAGGARGAGDDAGGGSSTGSGGLGRAVAAACRSAGVKLTAESFQDSTLGNLWPRATCP